MDGLYKIGAVSKITGINIPTLRSWENKFDIVTPTRVNGTQRGYTKQDLDKLVLIQALIDSGDSISSLRGLSLEQLQSRLLSNDSSKNDSNSSHEKLLELKVITIGTMIPDLEAETAGLPSIKVAKKYDLDEFTDDENEEIKCDCDLIIFELATLHIQTINWIKDILTNNSINHCIILYRFASSDGMMAANTDKRLNTLRQPVSAQDIFLMIKFLTDIEPSNRNSVKAKHDEHVPFTDKELWEISVMANPIHCECPKHLSSIISSIKGFEKYSADCEELSESDRILHRELEENAKEARIIMEKSLRKVINENSISYSVVSPS